MCVVQPLSVTVRARFKDVYVSEDINDVKRDYMIGGWGREWAMKWEKGKRQ